MKMHWYLFTSWARNSERFVATAVRLLDYLESLHNVSTPGKTADINVNLPSRSRPIALARLSVDRNCVPTDHSIACSAHTVVKGDQIFLWRMSKLGVLELQNPRTNCHKIWHGWFRRRCNPARQNSNWSIVTVAVSRQMGDISSFFVKIFCNKVVSRKAIFRPPPKSKILVLLPTFA